MATLVFLAGAGIAYYNQQQEIRQDLLHRIEEEKLDFENSLPIELLPWEVSSTLVKTPRTTITFFKLPPNISYEEISAKLEKIVVDIVEKNHWLAGFIAKRPDLENDYKLYYEPKDDFEKAVKQRNIFTDVASFSCEEQPILLSLDMPGSKWLELTENLKVASSDAILNRKSKPLWKVSIVPTTAASSKDGEEKEENGNKKEVTGFALVVSMCHALGDYHTFYQLYGMVLDSLLASTSPDSDATTDQTITKLNPFRYPDFEAKAAQRLGAEELKYINHANPALWEQNAKNTEAEVLAFTVSKDWIAQNTLKQGARRGSFDRSRFVDATIISWFMNLVKPTVGFYANSLRDFLEVIDDSDAGNYQNPIPLLPEDYATPQYVQQSLLTGKRFSDAPLPKFFDYDTGMLTFCFGVNWLGHASCGTRRASMRSLKEVLKEDLTTTSQIEQELHMPLMCATDMANIPSRCTGIILFEPNPNEVGVLCICKKEFIDKINKSGIIDKTLNLT